MNRYTVKKFLSQCPNKDFVDFLVGRVNLTELELKILDYKINKHLSDEKISDVLDKSIEYTHKAVRNTFDKISNNWDELFDYINNFK